MALRRARELVREGFGVTLNYLGEHYHRQEDVRRAVREYFALIVESSDQDLHIGIAVKPSQLGMNISSELFARNLKYLVHHASKYAVPVEIDIEEPAHAECAIQHIVNVANNPWHRDMVRIAIAANMPQTYALIQKYSLTDLRLRLVKGGVYQDGSDQITNEEKIANRYMALGGHLCDTGTNCYFATVRDRALAERIITMFPRGAWKFEMLYGPWKKLQHDLLAQGYPVVIYAPYGYDWIAYGLRRWKFLTKIMCGALRPHRW